MSFPVLVPEILAEVELVFSAVALWLEQLSLSVVWILTHQGQLWRPQQLLPCSKIKIKISTLKIFFARFLNKVRSDQPATYQGKTSPYFCVPPF